MKCVCGRELEHGKSLCYVCETLSLLPAEDCDRYLKLKEGSVLKILMISKINGKITIKVNEDYIRKMGGKENDAQSGFRGTIKER